MHADVIKRLNAHVARDIARGGVGGGGGGSGHHGPPPPPPLRPPLSISGVGRFYPVVHSFCDRTGLCTKPGSVGMRL